MAKTEAQMKALTQAFQELYAAVQAEDLAGNAGPRCLSGRA